MSTEFIDLESVNQDIRKEGSHDWALDSELENFESHESGFCNRTAIGTNKPQHEYPDCSPGSIEDVEASTCETPRHTRGIEWARSRRSRDRTIECARTSCPYAWSGIQRYVKNTILVNVLTLLL